jgi:hypothetical protein
MQALSAITGPNNTTTILPIPVDLISNLIGMKKKGDQG